MDETGGGGRFLKMIRGLQSLSSGRRRAYLTQPSKMKAKKVYDKADTEQELSYTKAAKKHQFNFNGLFIKLEQKLEDTNNFQQE